jgi:hypothetical protein
MVPLVVQCCTKGPVCTTPVIPKLHGMTKTAQVVYNWEKCWLALSMHAIPRLTLFKIHGYNMNCEFICLDCRKC